MKKEDFLVIPSWIYELDGIETLTEAAVLAKIYSLAPDKGMITNCSVAYLCEITLCAKRNVINIINKLCDKGLVQRGEVDYKSGVKRMHLSVTDKVRNHLSEPEPDTVREVAADIKEYVDNHTPDTIDPEELAIIASKRFIVESKKRDKKENTKMVDTHEPTASPSSAKPIPSTTNTNEGSSSSPTPQSVSQTPPQEKTPAESPQYPPHGDNSKPDDDDRQTKLDNWIRTNEWDNLLRFTEPLQAAQYQKLKELEPNTDRINRKLAALDAKAASNPDYAKGSVYKIIKIWLANKDK